MRTPQISVFYTGMGKLGWRKRRGGKLINSDDAKNPRSLGEKEYLYLLDLFTSSRLLVVGPVLWWWPKVSSAFNTTTNRPIPEGGAKLLMENVTIKCKILEYWERNFSCNNHIYL